MAFTITHYEIEKVKPGMVVGKPVLNRYGRVLLADGIQLNQVLINRLKDQAITVIAVREEPVVQNNRILLEDLGILNYLGAVAEFKNLLKVIRHVQKIPVKQLRKVVSTHILPIVDSYAAVNYLNVDRPREEYMFHHSVNVSLLSSIIGKWLGYNAHDIAELALAGLLHDIGKTQVPEGILYKAGRLAAQEMHIVQLHSAYSYKLLRQAENLPFEVMLGILQHHERLDGSGYPGHFPEAKIHQYARIIAVADIYDAMTSDRAYRDKATPFAAAEELASNMFSKLDAAICSAFLEQFTSFMLGNLVELKSGQQGEIIYLGSFLNSSPIIRCRNGEMLMLSDIHQIRKVEPFLIPGNKNFDESNSK